MADVIHDQRHIYGGRSIGDIHDRWLKIIDGQNAARLDRMLDPIRLHDTGTTVRAFVNQGRWVAHCQCGGGMGCWAENSIAACMDCGSIYEVEWPEKSTQTEAERLLRERPNPATRNWEPWTETLAHLELENEAIR